MVGCTLYVTHQATLLAMLNGGTGQVALPIPNNPSMVGRFFFNQALALDPAANPLGISASNFGRALIWELPPPPP